jgi:Fe-S oxidoreductase
MQMAELSLLPKVRKAGTGVLIVADGTSCRQQIAHGLREGGVPSAPNGTRPPLPLHVAQVLKRALS